GRADLRDLFDRDEREQRAGAGAAVLLVEQETEDALVAEQLDDVPRELVRGVELGGPRRDPLARERADVVAQLSLIVAQDIPGHGRSVRAMCPELCGRRGDEGDVLQRAAAPQGRRTRRM